MDTYLHAYRDLLHRDPNRNHYVMRPPLLSKQTITSVTLLALPNPFISLSVLYTDLFPQLGFQKLIDAAYSTLIRRDSTY